MKAPPLVCSQHPGWVTDKDPPVEDTMTYFWHLLFLADTDFFLADTDFFCRLPIFGTAIQIFAIKTNIFEFLAKNYIR